MSQALIDITESVYGGLESKIDLDAGVIRNVKIIGTSSKNGYDYPPKTLEAAVSKYEGVEVNVDHPDRDKPNAERRMIEGWGVVRDVRHEADGNHGDLHFLKTHSETPLILERINRFGSHIGLSHNAKAKMARTKPGQRPYIESIEHVMSVDLVRKPATTNGLFESEKPKMKLKVKSFAEQAKNARVKQLLESVDDSLEFEGGDDDAGNLAAATLLAVENQKETEPKPDPKPDPSKQEKSTTEKMLESLMESQTYLMQKEKAREHEETIRSVLEGCDIKFADLTPDRQQLLRESKDKEAMARLVGTWPPVARGRRGAPSPPTVSLFEGTKPAANIQELRSRLKV